MSRMTDVGDGFRGVCDHSVVLHRTVPVAARTPLLNHWLVCLTCEAKVCLSLHVSPAEKRAAEQAARDSERGAGGV